MKDKIINIWYPAGAGGNFLKLLLTFDAIPEALDKSEYIDLVNTYINNESYNTKSFDRFWRHEKLYKEHSTFTVEQLQRMKTEDKIVWANHFDTFNPKAYEVLKLHNHIVIAATTEDSLAKLHSRLPKTGNAWCEKKLCRANDLTLNKTFTKYVAKLFDNVLLLEYVDLLTKEGIQKLIRQINEQFGWNVDLKEIDGVVDFWLNDFTKIK